MVCVKKWMAIGLLIPFLVGCSNQETAQLDQATAEEGTNQIVSDAKEIRCVFAGSMYPESAETMAVNMFLGALDYRIKTHPDLAGKYTLSFQEKGILYGTQEDCISGVSTGAVEITLGAPQYLATLQPEWQLVGAPGVFDSWEHFVRTLETPEWQKLQEDLAEEKGITVLKWMMNAGDWYLFTKKGPIHSIDDIDGQTIRIAGGNGFAKSLKNMGATSVTLPYSEVITALQTNMIDGLLSDMPGAIAYYDLPSYTKYWIPLPWAISPQCLVVNTEFWESLPDNERQAIKDVFDRIDVSVYFKDILAYYNSQWYSNSELEAVTLEGEAEKEWKEMIKSGAGEVISSSDKELVQAIERTKER